MAIQIERIGTVRTDLGECPVWDAEQRQLWLADCRRGLIYRLDPEQGGHICHELPAPLGAFALNDDDSLVVALKEEIGLYTPSTGSLTRIARIDDSHPHLRLNDGTAMPDGSFIVGTMHLFREPGEPPLGGLYRLDPGGCFARLDRGLAVVNGPLPHPSRAEFYVADSAAREIYRYRIDAEGNLGLRVPFVDTAPLGSAPDGCCFDRDGGLWTTLVHAGAIVRFDADGVLSHRIALPVAHPTALCFGGAELDDIYVTSIRDSGRLRADGPLDGALLRVRGAGFRGATRPRCRIPV
ncbi:SMP-30/gluconolactonase/LRE family protein [Cupriavidus gilardii]|uniref:SMP-30/gluconolactonase/LRE family protein n=1 Tax=Cupriavidus gilardii TaxID=82541 RepID=UPI001C2CDD22|nr:SMP-30/gluconolactonase/LRE family protein [Cupriavidus gilardii]